MVNSDENTKADVPDAFSTWPSVVNSTPSPSSKRFVLFEILEYRGIVSEILVLKISKNPLSA